MAILDIQERNSSIYAWGGVTNYDYAAKIDPKQEEALSCTPSSRPLTGII